MKCVKCGTENNDGSKFCIKCGATLKDEKFFIDNISKQSSGKKKSLSKWVPIAVPVLFVVVVATVLLFRGSADELGGVEALAGAIVKQDGWFYYTENQNIYKVQEVGSDCTEVYVSDEVIISTELAVDEEWVYFATQFADDWSDYGVYRIKIDGGQPEQIYAFNLPEEYQDYCWYRLDYQKDGWIYFKEFVQGSEDIYSLKRISTDGKKQQTIWESDSMLGMPSVDYNQGFIYYYEDDEIYRAELDGSNVTLIEQDFVDTDFIHPYFQNGWVYCWQSSDTNNLYRIQIDDKQIRTNDAQLLVSGFEPNFYNYNYENAPESATFILTSDKDNLYLLTIDDGVYTFSQLSFLTGEMTALYTVDAENLEYADNIIDSFYEVSFIDGELYLLDLLGDDGLVHVEMK